MGAELPKPQNVQGGLKDSVQSLMEQAGLNSVTQSDEEMEKTEDSMVEKAVNTSYTIALCLVKSPMI